jgi:hypothetical protein
MVAAILVAVVGLMTVSNRRRIHHLEHELDEVYQAQHILNRARARKARKHLHLLVVAPLAWLAGRVTSGGAKFAAATAVSAGVTSAGLLAVDSPQRRMMAPPADVFDYPYSPDPPATTTSVAAVAPPAPAASAESAPPDAPVEAPAPTTTTTTTLPPTTTTLPVKTTTTITLAELCLENPLLQKCLSLTTPGGGAKP